MEHTKGEWYAVEYSGYWELQRTPYYGAPSLLNEESVYGETAKANAKLAAAAPDMLEALQLILNGVGLKDSNCFHNGKHIERIIREAIKKATE